jgi:hypothetical protein
MSALKLKLFVSHSSRLDDVEHKYTCQDRNWRLLEDTCKAIRKRYGDRVEVLVDKDGLTPGDDWNHRLNLWLAECHVAIILFSKRAIEKSDWVAKEAAILSWRAELDEDERFTLIPVTLGGESTPEDLARDFRGTLRIDDKQCIQDGQSAQDILAGVAPQIDRRLLAGAYPRTPLERLQEGIARLLAKATTTASLLEALGAIGSSEGGKGVSNHEEFAYLLARVLFESTAENPTDCFRLFQLGIDPLDPKPSWEWVYGLFKAVRSMWVDPRAAACIPLAFQHKQPIALAGNYVSSIDPDLSPTTGYTLARYLERAWHRSELYFKPVTLTRLDTLEEMQSEIRRSLLNPLLVSDGSGEDLDEWINQDPKKIVVVVRRRRRRRIFRTPDNWQSFADWRPPTGRSS